jgi:hypothetical protein
MHAFLDNGRNTVLQLGIYDLFFFQFLCAWITFFRPRWCYRIALNASFYSLP